MRYGNVSMKSQKNLSVKFTHFFIENKYGLNSIVLTTSCFFCQKTSISGQNFNKMHSLFIRVISNLKKYRLHPICMDALSIRSQSDLVRKGLPVQGTFQGQHPDLATS
jgi:hypothetical protein